MLIARLGAERALEVVREALDGPTRADRASVLDHALGVVGTTGDDDLRSGFEAGLRRWGPRAARIDVTRDLRAAALVGARLLVPGTPDWPVGLDDLGPHAPLLLWVRAGPEVDLGAVFGPGVALVGSRANTVYGAEVAAELGSAAADAGLCVISGGAYGIDAVAHRVALSAGTPTIAALAGGIDQLYPAGNTELLRGVAAAGAIVAESPPGTRPSRWRFLQRNRMIAALADAVVVVEASARSGALNTAHHAAQIGRPVAAVPGPLTAPSSAGCHQLVADGRASLLVRCSDVVALVHPDSAAAVQPRLAAVHDDPTMLRVIDALGRRQGMAVDDVARRAGLGVVEAADTLALAELLGQAEHTPSGWRTVSS
jgi:DNA processing protein